MSYYLDWWTPIKSTPLMLVAALNTVLYTILSFTLIVIFGALFGYVRSKKKNTILRRIITVYIEIFRNTPLLVQVYILYFGLPNLGIRLNNAITAILAMVLFGTAYACEVFRGGIQSIDLGQWEAGACIGLSKARVFLDIIFPQALRNVFPSLINRFIFTLFATSLLSTVDIREITSQAKLIASKTFRTFEMYTYAMILYVILLLVFTTLLKYVNRRYFPSISSKGE